MARLFARFYLTPLLPPPFSLLKSAVILFSSGMSSYRPSYTNSFCLFFLKASSLRFSYIVGSVIEPSEEPLEPRLYFCIPYVFFSKRFLISSVGRSFPIASTVNEIL